MDLLVKNKIMPYFVAQNDKEKELQSNCYEYIWEHTDIILSSPVWLGRGKQNTH